MLRRCNGNNTEELYRRTWLITDALENYFLMRDKWFEGPKLGLRWLADNDPQIFELFHSVLRSGTLTPGFAPLIRTIFQLSDSQSQEPVYTRFVILLSHVKPELFSKTLAQEHVNYLKFLEETGQLELCGPFSSHNGGMIIVKVDSETEAKTIAEADPFVISGAQSYEIRKWELSCRANKHMGLG